MLGAKGMPAVVRRPGRRPRRHASPRPRPPRRRESHLVLDGSGRELAADDTAVVQFTAVTWASPSTVATSSWTDGGSATPLPLADEQIPGRSATPSSGTAIGSQVMVVVPADEAAGVPQPLVYVFDVLGAL